MIYPMSVNYSKVMQLVKVCIEIKITFSKKKCVILDLESSSDDDDLDDSDDTDKEPIEPVAVNRITLYS